MPTPQEVINPITIDNYSRSEWNNVLQSYPTAKMFFQKGNISRDQHGLSTVWPIYAGHNTVETTSDYQDVSSLYTMVVNDTRAQLDWGQYAVFKAVSKGQLKRNNGQEALVKYAREAIPRMYRDGLKAATGSLFWQFYNRNGQSYTATASNAGKIPFYGLPSVFTGNSAITWSSNTNTGTINNTNYGGLSCVLNGLTTVDNAESDAWTPSAFNTTSTGWQGGTANATFRYNAFEILTAAISASARFDDGNEEYQPSAVMLTRANYNDVAYQMNQKQSFLLQKSVGKGATFGIGQDMHKGLEHNGIPLFWDFHLPTGEGYVLNFNQMWLDIMPKLEFSGDNAGQLRVSGDDESIYETEVKYNDGRRAVTVSATVDGQFRVNPRYQTFLKAGA
jgi:hypothetical protein